MAFKTKFRDRQEFQRELRRVSEKTYDTFQKSQTILGKSLFPLKRDSFQYFYQLLKTDPKNRVENSFFYTLLREMYRSELVSAKSGLVGFVFACKLIQEFTKSVDGELNKNEIKFFQDWDLALQKLKSFIEQKSRSIKEKELKNIISEICIDPDLSQACWEAINIAGLEGKVFVENGKQPYYTVELKEGYSFKLRPYKFFLDQFGVWDRSKCQVLVVDGFVEKVSEIDQILTATFETKQPLVIVAHGFSEEVVSTLYLNRQKNLIDVIPLRVKQDVNNLNVINDIGVSCCQDPISSLKGQMLTYVKPEDLPVVNRVRVMEQNTTIENPKSHRAVENQINMLLAKREDNRLVEDIQNIIDARIKSLVPNSVLLYLPEISSLQNDAYRTRLDNAFRSCKTLLNYGVLDGGENFKEKIPSGDNHLERVMFNILGKFMTDFDYFPTLSLFIGPLVVGKNILMLLSSAGLVEIDQSLETTL
jgi:hypothetical protein